MQQLLVCEGSADPAASRPVEKMAVWERNLVAFPLQAHHQRVEDSGQQAAGTMAFS
jgi:hypothetical protein